MTVGNISLNQEAKLIDHIGRFFYSPLKHVLYTYPWGEKGTLLENESGPDKWQRKVLLDIEEHLRAKRGPLRIAIGSGHGVGKGALSAWLIKWFMDTHPHPQIPVTANTKVQLETKTWRELAKWHGLAVTKHWCEWTATKYYNKLKPEYPATWFASAIPWSRERSEAFAGTHEKHVMFIFDEASAIDDVIWEVTEGGMTEVDGTAIHIVLGNRTKNTGRFSRCFKSTRWNTYEVDSREAKKTNKDEIEEWIKEYGIESDFVRVRVLGKEPRAGMTQLIGEDLVDAAMGNVLDKQVYVHAPKVLGVDVARFGDDKSVIARKQGLNGNYPLMRYVGVDTMRLASIVAKEIDSWEPDAVFVDVVGIGAGVVDRLRQLGYDIVEVNAGVIATEKHKYHDKRAEMWSGIKKFLEQGGSLPDDSELKKELIAPEFQYDSKERIQLERKKDMKARGLPSPDAGDAVSMLFADSVVSSPNIKKILRGLIESTTYEKTDMWMAS